MRINSDKGLALAREVLREHGGDWEKVRAAGRVRDDGVIVLKRPKPSTEDRAPETAGRAIRVGRPKG
jgi:hypothetical protein